MIISLIFVVLGVIFLIWHNQIGAWVYKVQRPWLKAMFSWLVNVETSRFEKSYNIIFLVAGILLLLFAYFNYFGPIIL